MPASTTPEPKPKKLDRNAKRRVPISRSAAAKPKKLDLKKRWKDLYQPPTGKLVKVDAPPLAYLMVDGEGDPNSTPAFQDAIEALYSLAYTLKFSLKKRPRPVDYGVMPLEALWWANEAPLFYETDKSNWKWTAMILQPDFITRAQVDSAIKQVRQKKNPAALDRVRFDTLAEGPSVQVLYVGPFSEEKPTIERMHEFIRTAGKQLYGRHHEIYLSDPRRTASDKLKTILRQPMR